jgi:hypothetical protein
VYWVNLVECRHQWRTVVIAVMNIWFPRNVANFLSGFRRSQFDRVKQVVWLVYIRNNVANIFIVHTNNLSAPMAATFRFP